jgi:glycosyltransferase involved in cell wall biosynthesis
VTTPQRVVLAWKAASYFGWGIAGQQIALQWCREGRVLPVMAPLDPADLWLDPLRMKLLEPAIRASAELAPRLARAARGLPLALDLPVVHAMGNSARGMLESLRGARNVGRIVFENTHFAAEARERLRAMDVITVVSRWNAEVLRSVTDTPVVVIHEGVDASLFFPGPRSGLRDESRFYVFSGGKAEHRKGQDLVLAAFRIFATRHPDAVLVTSWQSPWPEVGIGLRGVLEAPLAMDASGKALDVRRWAAENGVDPARVVDVGQLPNLAMPLILREMDCAVCASRAEGGTSFPLMEAMACGVPVILPGNTGMRDLIDADNAIVLRDQKPVRSADGHGTEGWGACAVDELVAAFEALHASSELRRRLGAAGARFMRARTWGRHAAELAGLALGTS